MSSAYATGLRDGETVPSDAQRGRLVSGLLGSRARRFLALSAALGLAAAATWVIRAGGGALLKALTAAEPAVVVTMIGVTGWWLLARFLRWHYLLRRVGVRLPLRGSVSAYLAGLLGTATPAYVGEFLRTVFIKRRFGVPVATTAAVLIWERILDVATLLIILLAATHAPLWLVMFGTTLIVAAALAGLRWTEPLASSGGFSLRRVLAPGVIGVSVLSSLLVWLPATQLLALGAAGLDEGLGTADSARVFCASTLGGAASLMPAGIGVTGGLAIVQLEGLGFTLASAIAVVSLVRVLSTGLTLTVGLAFLWYEVRAPLLSAISEQQHFDEIAAEYRAQFSPHVWDHLLARKTEMTVEGLGGRSGCRGLDLGCGLGFQGEALRRRGYPCVGIDRARGLLAGARARHVPVAVADGGCLPFPDAVFDFVVVVGVLHHVDGLAARGRVLREVHRVLRAGGRLVVHETNPRNPLFRFYMGYVFPLLKRIDEGTETWLDPDAWSSEEGFETVGCRFFTFLPDFVPQAMLEWASRVERWLERSPLRSWAVHYMVVLEKTPGAVGMLGEK